MSNELKSQHQTTDLVPGPIVGPVPPVRELVCIQVDKVYDACSQRHCFEHIRFCFPRPCTEVASCRVIPGSVRTRCELTQVQQEPPLVRATVDLAFTVEVKCDSQVRRRTIIASRVSDEFPKQVILFGLADEMFCKVEPVFECLGCDITQVDDIVTNGNAHVDQNFDAEVDLDVDFDEGEGECENAATIVECDVGVFIEIKTVAKVQLLVPSYGFCPVPPECQELSTRCEEFLNGPPPRRFPRQPFEFDR